MCLTASAMSKKHTGSVLAENQRVKRRERKDIIDEINFLYCRVMGDLLEF